MRLLFLLFAVSAAMGQSINCLNNVTVESRPRAGPDGAIGILVVHSEDDHGKNTHLCMSMYSLRILLTDGHDAAAGLIPAMGFFGSDGEWGRRLSIHFDGFSTDGDHLFGVLSEGGKYSFATVFDFRRDGSHSEIQIRDGSAGLRAARCGTSFAVAGRTFRGELVLQPNTADRCGSEHYWTLDPKGNLRIMKQDEAFERLFGNRGR